MIDEVKPESYIEWLWTLDLVELSWEILRYRQLKTRMPEAHRVAVVEAILTRGREGAVQGDARGPAPARRAAVDWRNDQEAAIEIEARLARGGFDQIDINAEVFVQAREQFAMFDQLMQSAQSRRIGLMREISSAANSPEGCAALQRVADDS